MYLIAEYTFRWHQDLSPLVEDHGVGVRSLAVFQLANQYNASTLCRRSLVFILHTILVDFMPFFLLGEQEFFIYRIANKENSRHDMPTCTCSMMDIRCRSV